MANRFAKRIKSGEIDSIDALKSEFKELAKRTHPDLSPSVESGAEFVAIRAEYEAALRNFEKHRFGSRLQGRAGRERGLSPGPIAEAVWPCLQLLLKRGFPKRPRHEKETLRYEYACWRLEQALGPERSDTFRAFESALLDIRATRPDGAKPAVRLLEDLIEFRYASLPAMRTHIVLALGQLKAVPGIDSAVIEFLSELASAVGIGGEIGA